MSFEENKVIDLNSFDGHTRRLIKVAKGYLEWYGNVTFPETLPWRDKAQNLAVQAHAILEELGCTDIAADDIKT